MIIARGKSTSKTLFLNEKTEIATRIAELSRLLGMIPADDGVALHEPLAKKEMVLSEWLGVTRESFLKLSLLIAKELDIELQ